ncbi:hypothetical protein JCM15765_23820 [Paradesulfitobacterium aromaticivorans]
MLWGNQARPVPEQKTQQKPGSRKRRWNSVLWQAAGLTDPELPSVPNPPATQRGLSGQRDALHYWQHLLPAQKGNTRH